MSSVFVGIPRLPSPGASEDLSEENVRAVRMACSILLGYPTPGLPAQVAAVRDAVRDLPTAVADPLNAFCDATEYLGIRELEIHYVDTFDQRRRCALGLTYYTHGDTRGRGQALLVFAEVLKRAGFEITGGELPDHLPAILEFAALDDSGAAEELLRTNREGIEVIRTALKTFNSPYSHILDALVATLPEPDEQSLAAFKRLINQGPPTELVGLGDLTSIPKYEDR